jgi:molybdate transport system substrate-binding protein
MRRLLLALSALASAGTLSAEVMVFSAVSTREVMEEAAAAFHAAGGETVRFNFASSGALARQIEAGAPAEVFVSANVHWMDDLVGKGLVETASRRDLARNELVLVVPRESRLTLLDFPRRLSGRLAVGDFTSVPAGAYARAALLHAGWLGAVQDRLVKGANVRTVLLHVERGEAEAGIVYATDARRSTKVRVLHVFPAGSHPSIVYPAACLKGAGRPAAAFLELLAGAGNGEIWRRHGFLPGVGAWPR